MTTGKTGAGGYKYFNEKAPEHDTFFCLHFNVFEKYFQRCYVTATWCGAAVLFVQPFPKHSLIYHYICLCVSGVILYVLRCSCTCTCILLIIGEFPVCVCVCVCEYNVISPAFPICTPDKYGFTYPFSLQRWSMSSKMDLTPLSTSQQLLPCQASFFWVLPNQG